MVHVRPMTQHDLDAIITLQKSVPEAPHWPREVYDRFLADDRGHKRILIAEEGCHLLGFVAAQLILDVCELDSIVVAVTARRSGVGRALLGALYDWALTNQAIRVQLEVRGGNSRAIEFYLHSGFAHDGLRPAYYRDPEEDALLLSRSLDRKSERPNHGGKIFDKSD